MNLIGGHRLFQSSIGCFRMLRALHQASFNELFVNADNMKLNKVKFTLLILVYIVQYSACSSPLDTEESISKPTGKPPTTTYIEWTAVPTSTYSPFMETAVGRDECFESLPIKIFELQSHSLENNNYENSIIDLDNDCSDSNSIDIKLGLAQGSGIFLVIGPHNGTRMKSFGEKPPSFDDCISVLPEGSERGMPEVFEGNYFCIRTSEGKIGHLLVKSIDKVSEYPIVFEITFEYEILK